MNQKTIILTVILFALIVLGMFTYARLRSAELSTGISEHDLYKVFLASLV
jgi:Tfp pilus assembly protein PilX